MNPLQHLKDIHNPVPVPFWPLAPGWYIIFGLFLLVIIVLLYLFFRRKKKYFAQKLALKRLFELQKKAKSNASEEIIIELSVLMRRAALIKYSRREIAGLQGEAWLTFLDKIISTEQFSKGEGRILITAPYQRKSEINYDGIFPLVEIWIKALRK